MGPPGPDRGGNRLRFRRKRCWTRTGTRRGGSRSACNQRDSSFKMRRPYRHVESGPIKKVPEPPLRDRRGTTWKPRSRSGVCRDCADGLRTLGWVHKQGWSWLRGERQEGACQQNEDRSNGSERSAHTFSAKSNQNCSRALGVVDDAKHSALPTSRLRLGPPQIILQLWRFSTRIAK